MPRQERFLTSSQLERVRDMALLGMITSIVIERRADADPPVDGDYGDDFISYSVTSETRRTKVNGWFHSTPTPEQTVDNGQVVTVNTYRLYVPVGTDIKPGDHVHVGNADPRDDYTVSDTTGEGTWLPLLTCSLRKRE